jgi:hypothetical protein
MKLSEKTISVLRNMTDINPNLVFREGNVLRSLSESRDIMVRATIGENIPTEFGIFDMREFLASASMYDDPEFNISLDGSSVVIRQGNSHIQYFASSIENLTTIDKDLNFPEPDVTFTLEADVLAGVSKASSVLKADYIVVETGDGVVEITVTDIENETSNTMVFNIEGQDVEAGNRFVFNKNLLKVLPATYEVSISSKGIAKVSSEELGIEYFVALDTKN